MAARLRNGSRQPGRPVGRGSAQEVTPGSCIHASANTGQRTSATINAAVKARAEEQARHDKGATRSINRTSGHYPFTRETPRRRPQTPGTAAAHAPHQPRTAPGTRTTPLYAPQTFEKYAPCRGGVAGGSPFHVHRPHPLTKQRERARSANTTLQPTSHPKTKSKTKTKTKVKVKVKVKVKTITGTGAAKGAGQTRLRYRRSKGHGLNQPAAKTTAKRDRLNQRGQRGLQAVCVTAQGCAGIGACKNGQPLTRLPRPSRAANATTPGPQPAVPATRQRTPPAPRPPGRWCPAPRPRTRRCLPLRSLLRCHRCKCSCASWRCLVP